MRGVQYVCTYSRPLLVADYCGSQSVSLPTTAVGEKHDGAVGFGPKSHRPSGAVCHVKSWRFYSVRVFVTFKTMQKQKDTAAKKNNLGTDRNPHGAHLFVSLLQTVGSLLYCSTARFNSAAYLDAGKSHPKTLTEGPAAGHLSAGICPLHVDQAILGDNQNRPRGKTVDFDAGMTAT